MTLKEMVQLSDELFGEGDNQFFNINLKICDENNSRQSFKILFEEDRYTVVATSFFDGTDKQFCLDFANPVSYVKTRASFYTCGDLSRNNQKVTVNFVSPTTFNIVAWVADFESAMLPRCLDAFVKESMTSVAENDDVTFNICSGTNPLAQNQIFQFIPVR